MKILGFFFPEILFLERQVKGLRIPTAVTGDRKISCRLQKNHSDCLSTCVKRFFETHFLLNISISFF
jgi:hypothetical protein